MTDTFQALFEAVRAACSPGAWSRGVELTRASAVIGERGGEDEVVFRVSIRGGMISHTVRLFPEDDGRFCVYAPRLPGAHSEGETEAHAIASMSDVVRELLRTYRDKKMPIPWREEGDVEPAAPSDRSKWIMVRV